MHPLSHNNLLILETTSRTKLRAALTATGPGGYSIVFRRGVYRRVWPMADIAVFNSIAQAVESYYLYRFARGVRLDAESPERIAQKFAFLLYQYSNLRKFWMERVERVKVRKRAFDEPDGGLWIDAVTAQLEKLDSQEILALPVGSHSVW